MSLKKNRNLNLPERIADEIRDLITQGALAPGVQLRQLELAEQFGSSRVPLREALKRLTVEGIVAHDQNRGFFVATLSSDEAQQIYRIRHLLEAELLKSVQWPNEEELLELSEIVHDLENRLQLQDGAGWLSCHRHFYETVFNLSPQKTLVREVMRLLTLTERYRSMATYVPVASDRFPIQERHLLEVLEKQDRKRLLTDFDKDRSDIEEGIFKMLKMRGL